MTHPDRDAVVTAVLRHRTAHADRIPAWVLKNMAEQCGVSCRSIQRWVKEHLDEAEPKHRGRFEMTEGHLVAIRSTLNLTQAHKMLWPNREAEGWVSYPTFARAFNMLPSGIATSMLGGIDGMAGSEVYLSMSAPHTNHTWHVDHTEADIWVDMGRGQIGRPWVSTVRDGYTSARLAIVAYVGKPNEDSMCDLLATAAQGRRYEAASGQVDIGGLPVQIILDNAKEHFAEAMTRGTALLGAVLAPTKAYKKNQNGLAESTFNSLNKQLHRRMPGYTKGGSDENGRNALTPDFPDQIDPRTVLTIEAYQRYLDDYVDEQNTGTKIHRLGGMTPLEAWDADTTVKAAVTPATVRSMMLRHSQGHVVNAGGIRFRNHDYLAPELNSYRKKGLRLTVGFLKRETRFIDVFQDDEWICRAYDRNLLTVGQQQQILAARKRNEEFFNKVNAQAIQQRQHMIATTDAETYDEPDAADQAAMAAIDEAMSADVATVVDLHFEAADGVTPALPRQDPTTHRFSKRQRARATSEQTDARADKRDEERLGRLLAKRGFGGIGGTPSADEEGNDDSPV